MKEDLVPDEVSQSLILTPQDTARITHRVVMTKGAYPSTSFVIDHPVYGYIDSPTLAIDGGYLDADLSSGLVAFYNFFGNANDSSGNGYNGTMLYATLTSDFEGRPQNAYNFTASNARVLINHNAAFATSTVTISCWYTPKIDPTISGHLVSKYGSTTADRSYLLYRGGNTIYFYTANGVSISYLGLTYNVPNHIVAVYSGTQASLWINGVRVVAPTTKAYNVTGTTPLCIGNHPNALNDIAGGDITAVGWWNRALSDMEISRLYMGGYINDYPLKDGELVSVTQL
jgi:hypothetical protein